MSSQPKPDRSGGLQRTPAPPDAENEVLHAERRQLTVAFIDIVGSTPLSERIDPEEFFAVIRTYRDICDAEIRRYGGHIARLIGAGWLASFGVPRLAGDRRGDQGPSVSAVGWQLRPPWCARRVEHRGGRRRQRARRAPRS